MRVKTKNILISAIFCVSLLSLAKAELAKQINAILSQPSQRKVQFSVHIVKVDSGKTIYSHNSNTPLVPASNMKIIVSAAALRYLGPDYEYKTKVALSGNTLVVIGSGDPLLGDKDTDTKYGRNTGWIFEDIAAKLKKKNLTSLHDIIIDSTVFDDQLAHPNWPADQLNRHYACEVSGLNFNGNCIDIIANNIRGKIVVLTEPKTAYVKILNKVKAISNGKEALGSYRNPQPNEITVFGKCKKRQGPFEVAIQRPAALFGFLLFENLTNSGIKIKGNLIEKAVDNNGRLVLLAEYTTSIADCMTRCNKNSFGLAADALLKTIAANAQPHGKNGSWATGRYLIGCYLLSLGIEENQFYIDDGRGLSRQNKLSANAITKVLLDVYKGSNWPLYKNSLAAGGQDGTIAKYFKNQKYKGKIFGKTGYIAGVKSFSGICTTKRGDYIFSILTNNANGKTRPVINGIAKAIVDEADNQ